MTISIAAGTTTPTFDLLAICPSWSFTRSISALYCASFIVAPVENLNRLSRGSGFGPLAKAMPD
ncbi:hypothetical protein [Acidovorax sp.]|uniref:hypothetical protein n=1 Tax=Acidovorax sp. TaxID=1872122 RepID=UPI0025BFDBD0|nr:hypothetical protein [Acidovorax sp.]MBL7091718.1 hypothetical protein [Acidovorax sp.]